MMMGHRWTVYVRPRAFSLTNSLTLDFEAEAEALYLYEALCRAGEQVELCEERVEIVSRRRDAAFT